MSIWIYKIIEDVNRDGRVNNDVFTTNEVFSIYGTLNHFENGIIKCSNRTYPSFYFFKRMHDLKKRWKSTILINPILPTSQ